MEVIGRENVFDVRDIPMDRIYPLLDNDICRNCNLRVFNQCKDKLPDGSTRGVPRQESLNLT